MTADCEAGPGNVTGATQEGRSAEYDKQRAESRARHRIDTKLNIFAEILRARGDLSPADAATAAATVYETLSA